MYGNEPEVGKGVRASGKRGEVMVTTKVEPTCWRRTISNARSKRASRICGSTSSTCC